jgi:hypothetical protein
MNDQINPTPINTARPRRITFLLHLWNGDENEGSAWRASLEMPGKGKRLGFASLEHLFMYLADLVDAQQDIPAKEDQE